MGRVDVEVVYCLCVHRRREKLTGGRKGLHGDCIEWMKLAITYFYVKVVDA